jgi:hypothetical protein
MRQRRQRKIAPPSQNLDSFLDILTNTVGVLMFISLFVSLLAVESANIIKTPLVSESNKNPLFFEIRGDRIRYINTDKVQAEIKGLLESLPECVKPNIPDNFSPYLYDYYLEEIQTYESCVAQQKEIVQNFNVDIEYYSVNFQDLDSLVYQPKNEIDGESQEEISQENSKFQQLLKQFNTQEHYLAFIVRPDSFNTFRLARKKAIDAGFNVGWEPSETDIPIVFGSEGRNIGVQ